MPYRLAWRGKIHSAGVVVAVYRDGDTARAVCETHGDSADFDSVREAYGARSARAWCSQCTAQGAAAAEGVEAQDPKAQDACEVLRSELSGLNRGALRKRLVRALARAGRPDEKAPAGASEADMITAILELRG